MIVREIKKNPKEVIEYFDYFNDYEDTMNYLESTDADQDIIDLLEIGFTQWADRVDTEYNIK